MWLLFFFLMYVFPLFKSRLNNVLMNTVVYSLWLQLAQKKIFCLVEVLWIYNSPGCSPPLSGIGSSTPPATQFCHRVALGNNALCILLLFNIEHGSVFWPIHTLNKCRFSTPTCPCCPNKLRTFQIYWPNTKINQSINFKQHKVLKEKQKRSASEVPTIGSRATLWKALHNGSTEWLKSWRATFPLPLKYKCLSRTEWLNYSGMTVVIFFYRDDIHSSVPSFTVVSETSTCYLTLSFWTVVQL